jgi:hypothetical protein
MARGIGFDGRPQVAARTSSSLSITRVTMRIRSSQ